MRRSAKFMLINRRSAYPKPALIEIIGEPADPIAIDLEHAETWRSQPAAVAKSHMIEPLRKDDHPAALSHGHA
jgi:hypothetical protein